MPHVIASLVAPATTQGQDRLAVVERDDGLVIVVADGAGGSAGGSAGGAQAVTFVVQEVSARARATRLGNLQPVALLAEIDGALAHARHGGKSTAVVAIVTEVGIVGASVGDSGALLIDPAGTVDLTENQIHKPLLGDGGAVPMLFEAGPLDGTLLVATDGLLKYAPRERMAEVARGPDLGAIPSGLVDLVRLRSGRLPDDLAVVVCRHVV